MLAYHQVYIHATGCSFGRVEKFAPDMDDDDTPEDTVMEDADA